MAEHKWLVCVRSWFVMVTESRVEVLRFPLAVGVASRISVIHKVLMSHHPHIFLTPGVRSSCFSSHNITALCSPSQSSLFACILWIYTAGCFFGRRGLKDLACSLMRLGFIHQPCPPLTDAQLCSS